MGKHLNEVDHGIWYSKPDQFADELGRGECLS